MGELNPKEGWTPKNWCFWTVVLEKTLESPLDYKEINQSILKQIHPEYSLKGLMLKLPCFGRLMWRAESLEKTLMLGNIKGRKRRGWQRMRWLNGMTDSMDIEQVPIDGEGRGSLACCRPQAHKELDMTVWLNNNRFTFGWLLTLLVAEATQRNEH